LSCVSTAGAIQCFIPSAGLWRSGCSCPAVFNIWDRTRLPHSSATLRVSRYGNPRVFSSVSDAIDTEGINAGLLPNALDGTSKDFCREKLNKLTKAGDVVATMKQGIGGRLGDVLIAERSRTWPSLVPRWSPVESFGLTHPVV